MASNSSSSTLSLKSKEKTTSFDSSSLSNDTASLLWFTTDDKTNRTLEGSGSFREDSRGLPLTRFTDAAHGLGDPQTCMFHLVKLDHQQIKLFESPEVKTFLITEMKTRKYDLMFDEKDPTIASVQVKDVDMLEEAKLYFVDLVVRRSVDIKIVKPTYLSTGELLQLLQKARRDGKLCVELNNDVITFVSTKDIDERVCRTLNKVITDGCAEEIQMSRDVYSVFLHGWETIWTQDLSEEDDPVIIELFANDDKYGMTLKGTKIGVQKLKTVVYEMVDAIQEKHPKPKPINQPGTQCIENQYVSENSDKLHSLGYETLPCEHTIGSLDFKGNLLTVKVYIADITKLKVDVVVNAANGQLDHYGSVAYCIAQAAGDDLERESEDYIQKHGDVPVTNLAVTGAGRLPCKRVFHAVGPTCYDYNEEEKHVCLEDLVKTIFRCLCAAKDLNMTSIAIPAIGPVISGVPKVYCAEMYVRAVKGFDLYVQGGSLKEVHFVDENTEMVDLTHRIFSQEWEKPVSEETVRNDQMIVNEMLGSFLVQPNSSSSVSSAEGVVNSPVLDKLKSSNQYNPKEYNLNLKGARFFIIKSYSEVDIHRSIKYGIWSSTEHGNKRLDKAMRERDGKGPIFLLFSVNGSGHFCGMAQMVSLVDYEKSSLVRVKDTCRGEFEVKWIYVKDVPNSQLRHIRLENNENKPVTNSRDTQEVPPQKGKQVLEIIHSYEHKTSIFDDFTLYEKQEEEGVTKKSGKTRDKDRPQEPLHVPEEEDPEKCEDGVLAARPRNKRGGRGRSGKKGAQDHYEGPTNLPARLQRQFNMN
ncbi:uncharacterized protein LOC121377543 [Gigantopelta aegis]|uniref:uncharacterized protein LOC121377543 n=1 Tax=Gigantopelta aegis TaxID=1735272 RepID=UPI001B88A139|nr:uncharacterized protein LOC121377543 [Gigantopelta aegis]XP_041361518.1 uncharacterized protein LOC121377543 [Gigantopelta aegis]